MSSTLWLIGSGYMAQEYAAVLQSQDISFSVIGRGSTSSQAFTKATGLYVYEGGLELALNRQPAPDKAIITVGVEQLSIVADQLIRSGCRNILLEKPGAISFRELKSLYETSLAFQSQVWIAYNRRFFSSVDKLRELVLSDGGITSAIFEFTEWSHTIRELKKAPGVKEKWLLANSSHVIDLAFHLIGFPAEGSWEAWHSGSLDWHSAASRFHGAGVSQKEIPFVYHADWEAPGRWGIELLTRSNRYILRPMESLQAVPLGAVDPKKITLNDEIDRLYKPGLYNQCRAFLAGSINNEHTSKLCSLKDQLNSFPFYYRIAGYQF